MRLLLLLLSSLLRWSESLEMTVVPDPDSGVHLRSRVPTCTVCPAGNDNATSTPCDTPALRLTPGVEVTLQFSCSEPLETAYTADIERTIACTKDACSPPTGSTQASFLTQLPRNLTWVLGAPPEGSMAVLNILGDGLAQVSGAAAACADGFRYTLSQVRHGGGGAGAGAGEELRQAYCRGGADTRFALQSGGTLALLLEPGVEAPPIVFTVSSQPLAGPAVQVTLDPGVTVVIGRRADGGKCEVCTEDGAACSPTEVSLSKAQTATTVQFGCLLPQEVFNVRLQRKIECTATACTPGTGKVQAGLFTDFRRTFSWNVGVPKRTVLTLAFPAPGLRATTALDTCPGVHKYSFTATSAAGEQMQTAYCGNGPLSQLTFPGTTSLVVGVPEGEELKADAFTATVTPSEIWSAYVTPDPDTLIMLSREGKEPDCEVCVDQKCVPMRVTLRKPTNASVEFGCPRPQELYEVEVNQDIDCTATACSGNSVRPQATLFPGFNRTFTWDLKVPSTQTVQMDFPEPGLMEVSRGASCADGHTYSLVTYLRSGPATIGTYCQGGPLSSIQVRYKARMILVVPGDQTLDTRDFKLSVGPETKMLAIVKVDLPRGVTETSFTAANFPGYFPDGQQMGWDFRVPGMHNYTVRVRDHRLPEECLSERVQLEYRGADLKVSRPGLGDPQPSHRQGDFNMSLSNCKTNGSLEGLLLAFTVAVMRSGHPVLCTVDLTKMADLSLQIQKVGSDPYCEMIADSRVQDGVTVAAGTSARLSFLDCPNEDLRLTASRAVGCLGSRSCSLAEGLLSVPRLDACLPMALHSFTWRLRVPENGTVDLGSPALGGLRQSLPGQECNGSGSGSGSVTLRIASVDASDRSHPIGTFCQQGVLEKLQVHANVSVTVEMRDHPKARGPFLNVSITDEISEHIIYTVRPQISSPALLATPNWPDGMKPSSTVSWLVLVPSQYRAVIKFSNVTQPSCDKWHTGIKVQPVGSKEETLSRREDEVLEDQVVAESFFLNMSNCLPDKGRFSALTKVTLQPKSNLVGIILGVLGAVLLLVLVFVAACLVLKKKKRSDAAAREASIYIGKGNIFRTGDAHFAKARADNASHVYDSIDEAKVYGHLLRDSTYADDVSDHFQGMQGDTYHTFLGGGDRDVGGDDGELAAIDRAKPPPTGDDGRDGDRYQSFLNPADTFLPPRPRTPIDRQESLGFQDRRMVDNELYTFKSTGGFNTIRLSGADQQEEEFL